MFYKTIKEENYSDEFKFLIKLFDSKIIIGFLKANSNMQSNLHDLLQRMNKKIEFNTVELDKMFSFMQLNDN